MRPTDFQGLVNVGQFTSPGRRFLMYANAAGNVLMDNSDNVTSVSSSLAAPAYGDTYELLGVVQSDGKVNITKSIGGGAESSGGLSAVNALPASFVRLLLDLGHEGGINAQVMAAAKCKVGPLSFRGQTVDTIAKARAL